MNVSRGGFSFESRNSYELDDQVSVAMHYRENAIDVLEMPSRIVRVSPAGKDGAHSYGLKFES